MRTVRRPTANAGSLDQAVAQSWRAFDRAAARPSRVSPAAPILFFGDLAAYRTSALRVLTVGLNPSLHEFPEEEPFRRFLLLEGARDQEPDRYLDAMSRYFRTDPYRAWFSAFEPLLNGAGASYYPGKASTALHTDICSPVPTSPTWSQLDAADRAALEADGGPLWRLLIETLQPQIVAMSVAKVHLERIALAPLTRWNLIHVFERTARGDPRSRPYEVRARWYEAGGERSLFVFGAAAQKPFGLLSDTQKRALGAIGLRAYKDGW